ncbi:DUF1501 domain-containing protein [Rhodopirellula sp. JC740]|uniref:DUF1501 domain-containing protein n=1 Tax=Rhodopirellula halodulae TaxID=2894198 RepID=A0ABS8NMG1_9BACT|nr:DUF1501 domain-containing protein [Rhodopirellula sp. JC740]MCC9644768.1 DUF1501 domain-containing protein [Rhodopirellula sp. JC740]
MNPSLCTGFDANHISRREMLAKFGYGLGGIALGSLLNPATADASTLGLHHAPKAKRVIFLFQSGGPSQIDLFDNKPMLNKMHGQELPASVRMGQRLTGMSAHQSSLPMVGSPFKFQQHGESGMWMSELMPHTARFADDLCVIKTMNTEAINHGPGVTMMQTGSQFPGRPSMGSWMWYGLGSDNEDLPAFVVMVSTERSGQPLVSRLWGSGFLPGKYDGVRFRASEDAVLYLNNPNGISREGRRRALDHMQALHQKQLAMTSDPVLETHIAQYEMAFRMQASVPDVTDISDETEETLKRYGDSVNTPGTYAANCLRARRLAQKGVRFIQLYQPGWDHHNGLPWGIRRSTKRTDQATAALLQDLKDHGMLDDTLVIWGGEFGRTAYSQGKIEGEKFGRDHHPRCFTMWMAGGGVRGGVTHGETDEFSYNVASDGVHIHDLHATILHLLGINHERLTFKYQGRHFRLTDVHGHVVKNLVS